MRKGNINCVLVKDLSRLGRNYIEVGNYIEQIFPLFNIRFIAVNDSVDSFKNPTSTNTILVPFKNLINGSVGDLPMDDRSVWSDPYSTAYQYVTYIGLPVSVVWEIIEMINLYN